MAHLQIDILESGVFYEGFQVAARVVVINSTDSTLSLAWISAQIHCQCTFNRTRVRLALPRRPSVQANAFNPTTGEQAIARKLPRCMLSSLCPTRGCGDLRL